jgi:hypothetical protein
MRIDDPVFHNEPTFNSTEFDSNFSDIDRLISEINLDENILRNRKKNTITYISSPDLDDIDDVIINIDVPPEYYTNKERQIMEYDMKVVWIKIVTFVYYIVLSLSKYLVFIVNYKKYK